MRDAEAPSGPVMAAVVALLGLLGAVAGPVAAHPLDRLIAKTVGAHYSQLHRCFRQALAVDRKRGGTLVLRLTFGAAGRVTAAQVARDELGDRRVARCVRDLVKGWQIAGAQRLGVAPGTEMLLPFSFRGVPGQFVVDQADVPRRGAEQRLFDGRECRRDRGRATTPIHRAALDAAGQGDRGSFARPASTRELPAWPTISLAAWCGHRGERGVVCQLASRGGSWLVLRLLAKRSVAAGQLAVFPARRPRLDHAVVLAAFGENPRRGFRGGARQRRSGKSQALLGKLPLQMGAARLWLARRRLDARAHLRAATVLYVEAGEGTLTVDARAHRVKAGQAAYIGPGRRYGLRPRRGRRLRVVLFYSPGGPLSSLDKALRPLR